MRSEGRPFSRNARPRKALVERAVGISQAPPWKAAGGGLCGFSIATVNWRNGESSSSVNDRRPVKLTITKPSASNRHDASIPGFPTWTTILCSPESSKSCQTVTERSYPSRMIDSWPPWGEATPIPQTTFLQYSPGTPALLSADPACYLSQRTSGA